MTEQALASPEPTPNRIRTSVGHGLRVAVVEDHFMVRENLVDLLKTRGFQVTGSFASAYECLQSIPNDSPQLIVVDVGLFRPSFDGTSGSESMDGIELLRELATYHQGIRTLVYSGFVEPDVVQRCYEAGAAGYLFKLTANPNELIDTLVRINQGERLFPVQQLELARMRQQVSEPAALARLTTREREILTYVAAGADNLKISAMLDITERTVKAHVSSLYRKLGQENRTQLALLARQLGVRPSTAI